MRPKSLILLLLALGCGLVASIGISQVINAKNQQPAQAGETENIFVAMKDISYGDTLNMQVLKLEPWPKHLIPPGAITKMEEVEGRLAGSRFVPGEPVLEAKLMGNGEGGGAAIAIPKGYRVVPVQVDNVSSISGLIKPKDRVDILVYISRNPSSGMTEAGTKTILQDVKVFAVNEQWRRPEEQDDQAIAAKTVSLLVTPAQAEKVTLATEMGKVRLILRSPEDDASSDVSEGTVASDIFSSGAEKSNREEETGPVEPKTDPNASNSMFSFLEQQNKAQAAQPVVAVAAPESFMMELLTGSEMRTVEFKKEIAGDGRWTTGQVGNDFVPASSPTPAANQPVPPVTPPGEGDSTPESEEAPLAIRGDS